MNQRYQMIDKEGKASSQELAAFLAREGQLLLPMVQLIEQAECAVDEVIDVMGRATIEAVLLMSAEQVAGPKQRGKRSAERAVYWYGRQGGVAELAERKLKVDKPRLRRKDCGVGGEVEVPAYAAMRQDGRLGKRMLEILMAGVSTRQYADVLPEMADQVGVSKSAVSRQTIEAGEQMLLKDLAERDFSAHDLLVIYIDGLRFGDHHVMAAVGVDDQGRKHVLALRDGATENTEVVKALLAELVERGVKPERRRLFVIDGAKALRKAIDQVYGSANPVQRCRNHKLRNVLGHLPKDQHDQARATLRAAWKLDAEEGIKKIEQYALWLDRDWPSAAASVREGLAEMFTVNRLQLPTALRRCPATTNLLDSTHSGVRQRTRRVTHWQHGRMALRWAAAAFVETETSYRRIMGHARLWMLKAHLDEPVDEAHVAGSRKVG